MADVDQDVREKFWLLLTTSCVSALIMLDSNIVAVSLPTIGRALGSSFDQIEWVINAYLLSYAGLLLAAGSYADLRGRKKTMIIGLVLFGISSAVCGAATGATMLNVVRAAQGVGGALLLTASLAIISNTFVGLERAHAFAVWGASLEIAHTAGPLLGGSITLWFGWRWIFFVNVPLCVVLVIAAKRFIKESRDPKAKRLDLRGVLTFTPGLFLLIWAMTDGNDRGWGAFSILARFAGAAMFFAVFVIVEVRQDHSMVAFSFFRRPAFAGAVFAMLGYGAAAQVMVFYLPLFLQNAYGYAAAKSGIAMMPFALPMVLVPRFTAGFRTRFSGRAILAVGLAVTCLGNLLFWSMTRVGLSYPLFAIGMAVSGARAGLLNGETVKVLSDSVPPERAGMASGISSTTRFLGILVGVAGLGAVLAHVARGRFLKDMEALGLSQTTAAAAAKRMASGDLSGPLDAVPKTLSSRIHSAALASFAQGFAAASFLAAALAATAAFLAYHYLQDDHVTQRLTLGASPCKTIDCRNPI